jgi:hypothetical protein
MLCHAEDAMEIALADGWYDPLKNTWDTEEHREQVMKAQNNCPHTKEGQNPYSVEWVDGKLVTKPTVTDEIKMENEDMDQNAGVA